MTLAAGAIAQTAQIPASTIPSTLTVKNLEKQLENPVTVDAEKTTLAEFIASLRKITQTNIVINWNALTAAGLGRDTPITLHLKEVPFEHVVKTLTDILPVKNGDPTLRLNYFVGDNTLSITTNAEMGKGALPRLYPIARPVMLDTGGSDEKLVESIVRAALVSAGEPMDARGHALAIKGDTLAAAVSERGHMLISKLQATFAAPTRPGQMPPGISLTATAKRGQEALLKAAGGTPPTVALFLAMARDPAKFAALPGLNLALMAGTREELAKPSPDLAGIVNDGGVVLIGPRASLQSRTLFAAYDLRDVLRRQAGRGARGLPGREVMDKVVENLKQKVPLSAGAAGTGEGWGTLDSSKTPTALVPYGSMLVVFAPADVQRQVTAALAELAR